jgi:hypothetical protein
MSTNFDKDSVPVQGYSIPPSFVPINKACRKAQLPQTKDGEMLVQPSNLVFNDSRAGLVFVDSNNPLPVSATVNVAIADVNITEIGGQAVQLDGGNLTVAVINSSTVPLEVLTGQDENVSEHYRHQHFAMSPAQAKTAILADSGLNYAYLRIFTITITIEQALDAIHKHGLLSLQATDLSGQVIVLVIPYTATGYSSQLVLTYEGGFDFADKEISIEYTDAPTSGVVFLDIAYKFTNH